MPCQARLDAPGTLDHVIIRGIEKQQIVDDKIDQNRFVERMGHIALINPLFAMKIFISLNWYGTSI